MLRVGLTGDLGSGKSTVGRMLAERGAVVVSSDEMGRGLMQPGHAVYQAIVQQFGASVVRPDGALDRGELARLAFEAGRVDELNAIVHPAVLAKQARLADELEQATPNAMFVVESALIFTTNHGVAGQPWRERFDRIVMVTAPEGAKIVRFVERMCAGRSLGETEREALESDARKRLLAQAESHAFEAECLVIRNDAGLAELTAAVEAAWSELTAIHTKRNRGDVENAA